MVNHALLLSDLALRHQTDNYSAAAVLPPFERIILDEAHHLEDVATSFFASQVTRFAFARVLNKLRHPRKPAQGAAAPLPVRPGPGAARDRGRALPRPAREDRRRFSPAARRSSTARSSSWRRSGKSWPPPWGGRSSSGRRSGTGSCRPSPRATPGTRIKARVRELARQTELLARGVRELLKECEQNPRERSSTSSASVLTDLRGVAGRLEGDRRRPELLRRRGRGAPAPGSRWPGAGSGRGTGVITRLCTAPLEVARNLKEALFDRFRTVVMTSATLAVGQSFDYLKRRVGLDRTEPGRVSELLLASPFDFARQALVAVPTDVPEPGRSGYPEMVRDLAEAGDPRRRRAHLRPVHRLFPAAPGPRRARAGPCGPRLSLPAPGGREPPPPAEEIRQGPHQRPLRHRLVLGGGRRPRALRWSR